MKPYSEIYINVSGGADETKTITLTLPWDADIEDWEDAFKTILTHQTFAPQTISELFDEPISYENLTEEEMKALNLV
jgi:hypothetical protein